jgi:2-oxoglutarate dehydrogenase E2 component (dihydrolipoamide succinyltransferase)
MAKIELVLPAMGEGIIEATITRWLISEGSTVEEDQPLLEIATDKVDSEIPSPVKGIVSKILMNEGEVPSVGDILAVIETQEDTESPEPKDVQRTAGPGTAETDDDPEARPGTATPAETDDDTDASPGTATPPETDDDTDARPAGRQAQEFPRQTPSGKFLTPLVRSIAREENVTPGELDGIKGSGEGGRITRDDILKYLESRTEGGTASEVRKESPGEEKGGAVAGDSGREYGIGEESQEEKQAGKGKPSGSEGDRIIAMDRKRMLIASHMVSSKRTSAHVTSFTDADVTELVRWREAARQGFQEREKMNLTYTPVFIEASARALRDFPMVNISVQGTNIIVKKSINIGMAVALPDGNLIVPVISNADEKNLFGLVKAVNDLAQRARSGKLQPHEISGGTFTVTNFGTFKNTTGTPVINQPEVAILGTGAIVKKPVVLETVQGDVIAIRHIMTLSLSYDHRVVDGALGGKFLRRIAEYLENFDTERKI